MTRETDLFNHMMQMADMCCAEINEGKNQLKISDCKSAVKEATDAYNQEIAKQQYLEWEKQGNPVEIAIRERIISNRCKAVSFPTTDAGKHVVDIYNKKILVDLIEMSQYIDIKHFHSPDWFKNITHLLYLIINAFCKDKDFESAFQFKIKRAAKAFNLSEEVDITSDTTILIALQQTVDGILFIPVNSTSKKNMNRLKVTEASGIYLWNCMIIKGSRLGELSLTGTGRITEWITDIMHALLQEIN